MLYVMTHESGMIPVQLGTVWTNKGSVKPSLWRYLWNLCAKMAVVCEGNVSSFLSNITWTQHGLDHWAWPGGVPESLAPPLCSNTLQCAGNTRPDGPERKPARSLTVWSSSSPNTKHSHTYLLFTSYTALLQPEYIHFHTDLLVHKRSINDIRQQVININNPKQKLSL